jgi:alpha-ribazole phosphatase
MKINFIRHGKTQGNIEKRYIGKTDEPLTVKAKDELERIKYPKCDLVYASPMLRCTQTAKLIYPNKEITLIDDFREIDFGMFEGHNYAELSGNPLYQKWIDSYGKMDFPDGESMEHFKNRNVTAFKKIIENIRCNAISLVVHGGTIMAILEYFEETHDYFKWQTANGCGYICGFDDGVLCVEKEITI